MSDVPYDVIVAGAGPAGAVAARMLAAGGLRVALVDKASFPRDKTCGDGLIPDSVAALKRAGAWPDVAAIARPLDVLEVLSPRGIAVPIRGEYHVLRRREFDHALFTGALHAGASFLKAAVKRPLESHGSVTGVVIEQDGVEREIRAPLTVLATGAEGGVLKKFDAAARSSASGYAIRTYATVAGATPPSRMVISLERDLLPGYAWAFPGPGGILNVGVGIFSVARMRETHTNLRARLDALLAGAGNLGRVMGPMTAVDRYAGAPLRTGLTGSSLGRRGLAILGDAAGTTYGLTGEGIGKAMESGLLLADLALAAPRELPAVGVRYAADMRRIYTDRFRTYETAQRWMRVPAFADLVAYRALRSPWVLDKLTKVLAEEALPNRVFSARALWALMTRK